MSFSPPPCLSVVFIHTCKTVLNPRASRSRVPSHHTDQKIFYDNPIMLIERYFMIIPPYPADRKIFYANPIILIVRCLMIFHPIMLIVRYFIIFHPIMLIAYIRKTSDVAGMAFLAKKNWRKIWSKNCLKSPKIANSLSE